MSELLARFSGGELIAVLGVGGGLLGSTIALAGVIWLEARKAETAAALKQDMLNRGMSAEEIRIVLDAGTRKSASLVSESQRCSA